MSSDTISELARQVTDLLGVADWGIGGSYLLYCHGLVSQAGDLDLVCSLDFYPKARQLLLSLGPELTPTPHPSYCSLAFCRVQTSAGIIELMAGIQVLRQGKLQCFEFHPDKVQWQQGLPLMPLSDWLTLYRLFDRPHRIKLLEEYLSSC